jgi:hypothetical protein
LWSEAKKIAAENGHGGDWQYIMGTFQRMKKREGGVSKKKPRKPSKRTVKARKK